MADRFSKRISSKAAGLSFCSFASIAVCVVAAFAATHSFLTGRSVINPAYIAMPKVGDVVVDKPTHSSLMRVTDHTQMIPSTKRALIVYSRFTPVNTSNQYVLVHGDNSTSVSLGRTSDGAMLATLKYDQLPNHTIGEVNEVRWDYTGNHPDRVYFVRGMKFFQMDVLTGNGHPVLVHDFKKEFPEGFKIISDVEGDSSNDSNYWAWMVKGAYRCGKFPTLSIFTYEKMRDKILGVLSPRDFPGGDSEELPTPNMVEVSPLGTKVVTHYGRCWGGDVLLQGAWVKEGDGAWSIAYKKALHGNSAINRLQLDGEIWPRKQSRGAGPGWFADGVRDKLYLSLSGSGTPLQHRITVNYGSRSEDVGSRFDGPHAWNLDFSRPVKVAVGETHSGWAFDKGGKEMFVSQNNRTDWIEARDISNGKGMNLISHADIGWGNGFHFGKFYNKQQAGWFLLSTYSKNHKDWGDNQILMVQLKPAGEKPLVWRIAPNYNRYDGKYRDEAPAALSHDGQSIWWTANWGQADGHGEVYRLTLPEAWHEQLEKLARRETRRLP